MPVRAVVLDSTTGRYLERYLGDAQQMVAADGRYSIVTTDQVARDGTPNQGYRNLAGNTRLPAMTARRRAIARKATPTSAWPHDREQHRSGLQFPENRAERLSCASPGLRPRRT